MVSEWNQWLVPAPITIMQRPRVFSAVCANSRAARSTAPAGTEVTVSCHAGVQGCEASS